MQETTTPPSHPTHEIIKFHHQLRQIITDEPATCDIYKLFQYTEVTDREDANQEQTPQDLDTFVKVWLENGWEYGEIQAEIEQFKQEMYVVITDIPFYTLIIFTNRTFMSDDGDDQQTTHHDEDGDTATRNVIHNFLGIFTDSSADTAILRTPKPSPCSKKPATRILRAQANLNASLESSPIAPSPGHYKRNKFKTDALSRSALTQIGLIRPSGYYIPSKIRDRKLAEHASRRAAQVGRRINRMPAKKG